MDRFSRLHSISRTLRASDNLTGLCLHIGSWFWQLLMAAAVLLCSQWALMGCMPIVCILLTLMALMRCLNISANKKIRICMHSWYLCVEYKVYIVYGIPQITLYRVNVYIARVRYNWQNLEPNKWFIIRKSYSIIDRYTECDCKHNSNRMQEQLLQRMCYSSSRVTFWYVWSRCGH